MIWILTDCPVCEGRKLIYQNGKQEPCGYCHNGKIPEAKYDTPQSECQVVHSGI